VYRIIKQCDGGLRIFRMDRHWYASKHETHRHVPTCPARRHQAVDSKEGGAAEAQRLEQFRPLAHQGADAGDTAEDECDIAERTRCDDETHVAALKALAQDKGILGGRWR
jgi:hypothetical protein